MYPPRGSAEELIAEQWLALALHGWEMGDGIVVVRALARCLLLFISVPTTPPQQHHQYCMVGVSYDTKVRFYIRTVFYVLRVLLALSVASSSTS
jgi:hypothetical protein